MHSLNTLEYNKLLALIARYAQTPMGKGYLENLEPMTNRRVLEQDLQNISETILLNEYHISQVQIDALWTYVGHKKVATSA